MEGPCQSINEFAESDTRSLPVEVSSFRAAGDRADTPGPMVGYYAIIRVNPRRRRPARTRCFGPFATARPAQILKTSALALGLIDSPAQAQLTTTDGTPQ